MSSIECYTRWMIQSDRPEVLAIERRSFEFAWTEDDFIQHLQQRNCIGMVAEHDKRVVGYVVFELHRDCLRVLNLAVHPEFRRRGIGTKIARKLFGKLSAQRRNKIVLEVRERNLEAQLFFRQMGFLAVKVLRRFYRETREDAYLFCYRYRDHEPKIENPIEDEARC